MEYIAITIVGGKAPFSSSKKECVSRSSRDHHVDGSNDLSRVNYCPSR